AAPALAGEKAYAEFAALDHVFQDSNRQAIHMFPIKLAALGLELVPADAPRAPGEADPVIPSMDDPVCETAGMIEHHRYLGERLMKGWGFGPRADHPPRRPSFLSWAELKRRDAAKVEPGGKTTTLPEHVKDFIQLASFLTELRTSLAVRLRRLPKPPTAS
ncbi:MAG: hypothetical protein ACRDD1_12165, partial [Planctomycetia bacterium]